MSGRASRDLFFSGATGTIGLSSADYEAMLDPLGDQTFTITVLSRVKWWKRPWCWLRKKPTTFMEQYTDVRFDAPRIGCDGSVSLDFRGEPV